jgi:hypothetical protein
MLIKAKYALFRPVLSLQFLVLFQYCSFFTVVLQYQYQNFGIVLQYKTARLVHPCSATPNLNISWSLAQSALTRQLVTGVSTGRFGS